MEVHQERKNEPKENALSSSAFLEKDADQDNYVFIDEKYKKYFDNISDIFEDKVEYVLNKHFKKNDPTNKNKLLCLNLCVLWQKKFLLLLSKTLNEYEEYKQKHNLNNEKGRNEGEISEKKKEAALKEKDSQEDKNITKRTTIVTNTNTIATNNTSDTAIDINNNNIDTTTTTTTAAATTTATTNTDTVSSTSLSAEKDLKSFIKNVKIIDNKNIEVVYDPNEINDNRPSAELSTEEIYYLLVESKKSENEYKKKIFTFLQFLPLIIQSMETKNYLEKKNLEQKLLFTEFNDMNNYQHTGENKQETHLNHQNMDMENPNHNNVNVNVMNMNMNMNNVNNVNNMNNVNTINNMNNMNHMNGIDNFGIPMNNVSNDPVNGNEDGNINRNINATGTGTGTGTDGFHLSEEEITNKLNAIVNFNYSLSENLEKLFKCELNNNKKKHKKDNKNTSNDNENVNNDDDDDDDDNNNNNNSNNNKNHNKLFKSPLHNAGNKNVMFSSNDKCQNENENTHNLKSLVLPLSRVNDLSMINNISAKTNNITYEDVNENENEYLFYIYKNNMDKTNLYGLDILTNLNNKVLCKINHIYSLVHFYTMLAKDLFDDS